MSSEIRAKLLAGPEVVVLEMARDALVIESDVRLKPGLGICLSVTIATSSYQARGRITTVDAALAGGLLKYRVGIKLDAEIPEFESKPPADAQVANERPIPQMVRTRAPAADPALRERDDQELEARAAAAEARAAAADARAIAAETRAHQVEAQLRDVEGQAGAAAKEADRRVQQAEQALHAAQQQERVLAARLNEAEAAWQKERAMCQAEATQARAEAEQALHGAQEQERAFAARLNEAETAWQNERAAWQTDATQARAEAEQTTSVLEKHRRDWTAQKARLSARLEATEGWCADQQELFYALQQQVGQLSTLLTDRKPKELMDDDSRQVPDRASAGALGRKTTA